MSFFYDLNKKLDGIRATPEVKHQQLNERDMGKHNNATTGFKAVAAKAAKEYGSKAAGERVAGAVKAKMAKAGKLEEQDMEESAFQAAIGKKKYGDEGMKALQKAGRDHASDKTMSNIRNKYDKYDEGVMDTVKSVGKKVASGVNRLVGHGSDEEMRKDLQRKSGAPVTGKKPEQKTTEAAKYRDPKYKDKLYTVEPLDYTYGPDADELYYNPKPDDYEGRKRKIGGGEFSHNDPLRKGFGRGGASNSINTHGKRKGLPSRDQITSLKGSIKDAHGTHAKPNLPEAGAPMTAKQKSFAKLAPPANKITFADKIAGAKKEVDEMLGDVAAEAMRNALSPKQKKIDMNKNGKLDANDFAMLRKGGKNAEMDEAMPPRGKMTPSGKMTPKKFKAVFNGPLDWPRIVKFKDRLMDQGMEPEEAEQEAAERLGFEYEEVLDYLDLMNSTNEENDFTAHQRPAVTQPKVGSTERGHKHDIKHTATGRVVTRRTDDQGHSVGADDDSEASGEKRGRGRPKGTKQSIGAKGPSGKSKLMTREGDNESSELKAAMALLKKSGYKVTKAEGEEELDEKAVSKKQQKFMGMAHAMQKGEKIPGASKELKKVAKTMKPSDTHDFAATKHKGLPEKVKSKKKEEEVEESSTTSGSVAPSTASTGGKGGVFGKGIYDSMNFELEQMIAESMSVNMSDSTEGGKSLTITATDEDALKLGMMLKNAGLGGDAHSDDMHSHDEEPCPTCGMEDCGCGDVQEAVDENAPDWPTNTETSPDALQYAGGLNKPKTDINGDGQTTIPNQAVHTQDENMLHRLREMAGIKQSELEPWKETMKEQAEEELDESKECSTCHKAPCECDEDVEESFLESIKRMREIAGIQETKAKPDFLDVDKDGNKEEPFKKAVKDKEEKKVDESIFALTNQWKAYRG